MTAETETTHVHDVELRQQLSLAFVDRLAESDLQRGADEVADEEAVEDLEEVVALEVLERLVRSRPTLVLLEVEDVAVDAVDCVHDRERQAAQDGRHYRRDDEEQVPASQRVLVVAVVVLLLGLHFAVLLRLLPVLFLQRD